MDTTTAIRPDEVIWSITNSGVTARALHVVADLGVADLVQDDPVDISDLAAACGADPGALGRVLRLLAANEIFAVDGDTVTHTDASRLLQEGTADSLRPFARMMNLPAMWTAVGALDHAVRTGRPGMEVVHPAGFFGHLEHAPADGAVFNAAMQARGSGFARAVVETYDFRPFRRIVDVAGGHGHLLRAVLDTATEAEGVLFELPPVAARVPASDRLTTIGGDFFADRLPAGDAYLLMEVLHDWPDDKALEILAAVRAASRPGAVVLVIEGVIPDGEPDPRVHNLDVLMLIMTGGRERTAAQLRRLLDEAGFRLTSVISTNGPMRIVEAVAV